PISVTTVRIAARP
ncbi:hypothetical protein EC80566_4452, partial [Escherichia coli 8.0566]